MLKPWLNLSLYQQEIKTKRSEQGTQVSQSFLEDLRKRGVPEEDLQKMTKDNNQTMGAEDDDVDPPPRTIK